MTDGSGRGPQVGPLARGDSRAAAKVLGEAFVDDPVWSAIGPHRRAHRRISNRFSFLGVIAGAGRQGARIRVARDADGAVGGVSIAFEPGGWPLSDGSLIWELGWLLTAGPLPAWRGLRDDRAMRAHHLAGAHVYLWFLGVHPLRQGRGMGRALLADLHAAADEAALPTYLETATRENVAFYERDGYATCGEIEMPSGPTMWRMERSPARGPDGRTARAPSS